jgi:hypothetical protein
VVRFPKSELVAERFQVRFPLGTNVYVKSPATWLYSKEDHPLVRDGYPNELHC